MMQPTLSRGLTNHEALRQVPTVNPLADRKTRLAFNRALHSKGVPAKACSACFSVASTEMFYPDKSKPGGRGARCIPCAREGSNTWRSANQERVKENARTWANSNRDRKRTTDKRWIAENLERRREANRTWARENAEHLRENTRQWTLRNPDLAHQKAARRRARVANVPHQPYDRAELFARWNHKCCYCDSPATDVEHILPISKGGADALHNLTIACQPCNSSKGAKTLAEWAASF